MVATLRSAYSKTTYQLCCDNHQNPSLRLRDSPVSTYRGCRCSAVGRGVKLRTLRGCPVSGRRGEWCQSGSRPPKWILNASSRRSSRASDSAGCSTRSRASPAQCAFLALGDRVAHAHAARRRGNRRRLTIAQPALSANGRLLPPGHDRSTSVGKSRRGAARRPRQRRHWESIPRRPATCRFPCR